MDRSVNELEKLARELRVTVLQMLCEAGSGHTAGPLGMAEVFTALYFSGLLHLDPELVDDSGRDRVILSAGHIVPIWYAALIKAGYEDEQKMWSLRKLGSKLQGHPHFEVGGENFRGIENTAGPLGQGWSVAVGQALGLRMLHKEGKLSRLPRVICIGSDGEMEEGQTWEALMSAAHYQLSHLWFVIDRNQIQISGRTSEIMGLEPLKEKLVAFGARVVEIDGNNMGRVVETLALEPASDGKPTVIVAKTISGKGVSFMEGKYEWHGKPPTSEELKRSLEELSDVK